MRPLRDQRGATLFMSLIMLLVMTLFVLSAINSSTVNLRIAGNLQVQDEAAAAAQKAIEQIISDPANFTIVSVEQDVPVDINNDGSTDYTVHVATGICKRSYPVTNTSDPACVFGNNSALHCVDVLWDINATVTPNGTGVSMKVHQGATKVNGPDNAPTCS